MALSESVLSDLLDAFRVGEGVDLIRDAVQLVLQELIETEATEQIGAARYERSDGRVTERNGSRPDRGSPTPPSRPGSRRCFPPGSATSAGPTPAVRRVEVSQSDAVAACRRGRQLRSGRRRRAAPASCVPPPGEP